MKCVSLVAVLFFGAAAFAQSPQAWDAKTIVWQDIDRDGTKWSVLEGDKNAVGKPFTYAFFIPRRDIGNIIGTPKTLGLQWF